MTPHWFVPATHSDAWIGMEPAKPVPSTAIDWPSTRFVVGAACRTGGGGSGAFGSKSMLADALIA